MNPEISAYALSYVRIVFPATIFYFGNQCILSFCAAQKITHFVLIATIAGTLGHALMLYLFCYLWSWGFNGIMWATFGNFCIRLSVQLFCISNTSLIPKVDDVYFFSKETITNLKPLIDINFTSGIMGVWSIWCLDIFTLVASRFSTTEFAAQSIIRALG